jgi:hypothetical protein
MLGGSTASGWADRYYDIEIAVFWNQDPLDDARRRIVDLVGVENCKHYPFNELNGRAWDIPTPSISPVYVWELFNSANLPRNLCGRLYVAIRTIDHH